LIDGIGGFDCEEERHQPHIMVATSSRHWKVPGDRDTSGETGPSYDIVTSELLEMSKELEELGGGDTRIAPLELIVRIKPPAG
jgi:hypothetical protein